MNLKDSLHCCQACSEFILESYCSPHAVSCSCLLFKSHPVTTTLSFHFRRTILTFSEFQNSGFRNPPTSLLPSSRCNSQGIIFPWTDALYCSWLSSPDFGSFSFAFKMCPAPISSALIFRGLNSSACTHSRGLAALNHLQKPA